MGLLIKNLKELTGYYVGLFYITTNSTPAARRYNSAAFNLHPRITLLLWDLFLYN